MGGRHNDRVASSPVTLLLSLLDEAFERRAWHGTTLLGALRGMTMQQSCWRPSAHRHNVWEIVLHCAYWKYAVRRRLTGERRGSFALAGSDWFTTPVPATSEAWRTAVRLLRDEHAQLRRAVGALTSDALDRPAPGGRERTGWLIRGIASHDLYHAGQIQLLKRLQAPR